MSGHTPFQELRDEKRTLKEMLAEAKALIVEYDAMFDMQSKRMRDATEYWQEATGNRDVLPDLGELLGWLMDRSDQLEFAYVGRLVRLSAERAAAREAQAERSHANLELLRKLDQRDEVISDLFAAVYEGLQKQVKLERQNTDLQTRNTELVEENRELVRKLLDYFAYQISLVIV